jgi:hypothetical protein
MKAASTLQPENSESTAQRPSGAIQSLLVSNETEDSIQRAESVGNSAKLA